MVTLDFYASTGYALELLAQSSYHKQHAMGRYFRTDVMPALKAKQARIYRTEEGRPVAMVTWAWLDKEVEREVHSKGRALHSDEWSCGDRLFFNDWITPYNNTREVVYDMTHNIFPDEVATSLQRRKDGSVLRVNRWTGANVRSETGENGK